MAYRPKPTSAIVLLMAWCVAVVIGETDENLHLLTRQMPVWATRSPEREASAAEIRFGADSIWFPEPSFTLFSPANTDDPLQTCSHIIPTVGEHHYRLAKLILFGLSQSKELIAIMAANDFELTFLSADAGIAFRKPMNSLHDVLDLIIDSSKWRSSDDVYDSFFTAVGAPAWHGRNSNALRDSIVTGDINRIEVPYRLHLQNYGCVGFHARQSATNFVQLIQTLQAEGCPIEITVN